MKLRRRSQDRRGGSLGVTRSFDRRKPTTPYEKDRRSSWRLDRRIHSGVFRIIFLPFKEWFNPDRKVTFP